MGGKQEESYVWVYGSGEDQFEFGYRQVWLYAWRHWADLVPECPRKEDNEDTPTPQMHDPWAWHGIASLAAKVGFESDEIDRLRLSDPDYEVARDALHRARHPEKFIYEKSEFETYVAEISRIFKRASEMPPEQKTPDILVPGPGEDVKRRSGRVFNDAYKNDRKYLFLQQMYDAQYGKGSGVSSFAVRASVFFAFFGKRLPAGNADAPLTSTATRTLDTHITPGISNAASSGPIQINSDERVVSNPENAVPGPSSRRDMPHVLAGSADLDGDGVRSKNGAAEDAPIHTVPDWEMKVKINKTGAWNPANWF
jgi:hypothetical protein